MLGWIKRLLARKKPRVFLGTLAVVPRSDLKRHFEFLVASQTDNLDEGLRSSLADLFTLPPVAERVEPRDDDLVLDVIITHHQAGGIEVLELNWLPIPFGWRPKVTVTARLSDIETNQLQNTYVVTEKLPWLPFLKGQAPAIPSFKDMFSNPPFDNELLNQLLYRACIKVLARVQRDVK